MLQEKPNPSPTNNQVQPTQSRANSPPLTKSTPCTIKSSSWEKMSEVFGQVKASSLITTIMVLSSDSPSYIKNWKQKSLANPIKSINQHLFTKSWSLENGIIRGIGIRWRTVVLGSLTLFKMGQFRFWLIIDLVTAIFGTAYPGRKCVN